MRYVIKAFLNHWNLLVVGGGTALGIISGKPDVIFPLLAAVEIAYLSVLSTRPNFQKVVDVTTQPKPNSTQLQGQKINQMLTHLTDAERQTFERLKKRLLDLYQINRRIKEEENDPVEGKTDPHFEGINRLLWIYLKLLYSKSSLDHFFKTIDIEEIKRSVEQTQKRIRDLESETYEITGKSKRRKLLQDTLETLEQRLENYRGARENYDTIEIELERLYSKISNLAEMGISRQAPEIISGEIDIVSESAQNTEKIMNELEFLTGVSLKTGETPIILRRITEE